MAKNNAAREKLVQKKLDGMTLEQKIGRLVTFGSMPDSLRVAAEILFGKAKPAGKWPLKKYKL